MKKYIKKPVEVEAIQYNKNKIGESLDFCDKMQYNSNDNEYYIKTLEGKMKVSERDYIIKGIKGEFYPCKPDIFEATYQSVGDFIDLNKLKNYECFTKGAALESQLKKVFEENKEFILETVSKSLETKILTDEELIKNRENIISEGLDVMTSMYNYLIMLGLTKEDFEKHITKLNKYKEIKYKR